MRFQGFIGPSNQSRSLAFDVERTINLYYEGATVGRASTEAVLYNRPGLTAWMSGISAGPIRAMFAENGRMFVISGAILVECFGSRTGLLRGTVASHAFLPATISSNGDAGGQLFITSGGSGYIYDLTAETLTQITDPEFPVPVISGLFFDGYFIALGATGIFQLSTLEDGTAWSGLDVAQESQTSSRTTAMIRNHDQLWLVSEFTVAPWYNSGAASFPFQPVPGSLMQYGSRAPFSFVELDNTVFWLGSDRHGDALVYRAQGFTPIPISTPAISTYLRKVVEDGGTIDDAIGWGCRVDSHLFYLLFLRTAPTTLVYDASTQMWGEWTRWNPALMRHEPFRGRAHCVAFGKHLVGDRSSGVIYELRPGVYSDTVVEL